MEYELIGGVAMAPVILGLVQLVKRTFPDFDSDRYAAALSVGFGVVIAVGYGMTEGQNVVTAGAVGVLIGLSASGLYSGVHSAREIQRAEELFDPEATRDG